jgi:AraC-like DNA-binding protein
MQAGAALGLDMEALCRSVGLDPGFTDPDERVAAVDMDRLATLASSAYPGPTLGLDIGSKVHAETMGVLGAMSVHTRGSAEFLSLIARYAKLIDSRYAATLEIGETIATYRFVPPSSALMSFWLDAHFAGLTRAMSIAFGSSYQPKAVRLALPRSHHVDRYEAAFRCSVAWSSDANAIDFPIHHVPAPRNDGYLRPLLLTHADALLEAIAEDAKLTLRVQTWVSRSLGEGAPNVDACAKALAMSRRSLHRHLEREGTSFREILDNLRRALALQRIGQGLSAEDCAFSLGYADVRSFHRAFSRWEGMTPREYRTSIRSPLSSGGSAQTEMPDPVQRH